MKTFIKIAFTISNVFISIVGFTQTTPNGTSITSYIVYPTPPLSTDEIDWINNYVSTHHNVCQIYSGPTRSYNCHAYAWPGSTSYWLNSPGDDLFWSDNSYVLTSYTNNAGTRVSYQGDHSGIVVTGGLCNGGTAIASKWGEWGLYVHAENDVPPSYLPGSPKSYYGRCASVSLTNVTYGSGTPASTVNFVSPGYYPIFTNIEYPRLNSNIAWNPSSGTIPFTSYGTFKINADLSISSGQSITFYMSSNGYCDSDSRNISFAASSSFYLIGTQKLTDNLTIVFDKPDKIELLPQRINIIDNFSGKVEKTLDINDISSIIEKENTINIDISRLSRGTKIIAFEYLAGNSIDPKIEIKSERVVFR